MLPISAEAALAKNSLTDTGVFLFFIEITTNDGTILHFVRNNEDITWRGETWTALAVVDTTIEQDAKGTLTEISLTLSNVSRIIQNYVENDIEGHGSGWQVTLYIVYSENLDNDTPEVEMNFRVIKVTANELTITFTLGAPNPTKIGVPLRRVLPNHCQAVFKNSVTGCTYTGSDTTCDKTIFDCYAKFSGATELPFVGFPSMPAAVLRRTKS